MAAAKISMAITEHGEEVQDEGCRPLVRHYQAMELIPSRKPVLHNLLDKQLSVWASTQMVSGLLSFGLGLVLVSSAEFESFLLTVFRVPFLNGSLFFIAGLLSHLIYREPSLLPVCLHANLMCLGSAMVGAALMCVDLTLVVEADKHTHKKTVILVFCVTLAQIILSGVLAFWIHKEQRRMKTAA